MFLFEIGPKVCKLIALQMPLKFESIFSIPLNLRTIDFENHKSVFFLILFA